MVSVRYLRTRRVLRLKLGALYISCGLGMAMAMANPKLLMQLIHFLV